MRIAKWLGDGAMLVSVDTMPLVAATLEMKAAIDVAPEPVTIKCGVTTGTVILLEGDDYIGHAVNVAARLCDLAVGQEVLAVASVVSELPPWATVETADADVGARPRATHRGGAHGPAQARPRHASRPGVPHPPHPCHRRGAPPRRQRPGTAVLRRELRRDVGAAPARPAEMETGSIREVWMR